MRSWPRDDFSARHLSAQQDSHSVAGLQFYRSHRGAWHMLMRLDGRDRAVLCFFFTQGLIKHRGDGAEGLARLVERQRERVVVFEDVAAVERRVRLDLDRLSVLQELEHAQVRLAAERAELVVRQDLVGRKT